VNDSGGGLFGNPDSVGYQVVTPFILDGREDGEAILVNRGWIPKRNLNPATRPQGQVHTFTFTIVLIICLVDYELSLS
jgi:surfeit locus 1 family protein